MVIVVLALPKYAVTAAGVLPGRLASNSFRATTAAVDLHCGGGD